MHSKKNFEVAESPNRIYQTSARLSASVEDSACSNTNALDVKRNPLDMAAEQA